MSVTQLNLDTTQPTILANNSHNDFQGSVCSTGSESDLSVHNTKSDKITQPIVKYYLKSYPGSKGVISKDGDSVHLQFQLACDEWKKCTGITFTRTLIESESDFLIRCAVQTEEGEQTKTVAKSFFLVSY